MSASSSFSTLVVHFVLTFLQTLHSNAFIDNGERGNVEAVLFTEFPSQFSEPYNLLYFKSASLVVHCQLRNRSSDTQNTRNALVNQYSSQGMAPAVTFVTLGWSKSYHFDELIQDDSTYWTINISKLELLPHETSSGKSPWQYKVELGKGLNLFESWGTLVIPDIEPILSTEFGDYLTELNAISAAEDVIVWQHPCTPGVAVLVPVFEVKQSFTGTLYTIMNKGVIDNLYFFNAGFRNNSERSCSKLFN